MGHASSRPDLIRVTVLDQSGRWPAALSRQLEDHLGAAVSLTDKLYINGFRPHVLIMNQGPNQELKLLRELREKWSEQELPVIVVGDDEACEIEAIRAGASRFVDRSLHPGADFLEKLVYGLACAR